MFFDTEGNPLVIGQQYFDESGDLFVVDELTEESIDVTYSNPMLGCSGKKTYYFDDVSDYEVSFTKVKQAYKLLNNNAAMSVSTTHQEAAGEPLKCLTDASTGTKNDSGKLRFDLLPSDSIQEVVQVITYGETKYPSVEIKGKKVQNWKVLPDNENRLFAATMRHLWQHRSGEILDQETKLKHLAHAASSLMFLINIENEKIKLKGS